MLLQGNAAAVNVFEHTCDSATFRAKNPDVCQDVEKQNNSGSNPFVRIIKAAIEVISFIIGVAAIIGIIVSGLRFILANGDSNAIASARSSLLYSLIGVAVAVLAGAIVAFVLNRV
jgi:ABC-type Fe3+ transport system permease subunit